MGTAQEEIFEYGVREYVCHIPLVCLCADNMLAARSRVRRPPGATRLAQHLIYRFSDVLDGYNGTVFAYGQTGSGKTFTMMVS